MSRLIPSANRYRATVPGVNEGIKASLYDFQTYLAAGQTSMSFFQVPIGQGGKTIADTNMKIAGQLSAGNVFIVEGIEILFYPGTLPVTAANVAAAAATTFTNDVYTVAQSGSLRFQVLDKQYVEEAPIGRFPPKSGLMVESSAAVATTVAAVTPQIVADYARFGGQPYAVDPYVTLASNMSFTVDLKWPALVPLPSTTDARIGVVLNGIMKRAAQ